MPADLSPPIATTPERPDLRWTPKLRLSYLVYQVLLHFSLPVLLVILFLRARREPLYRRNLRERFGFLRRARQEGGVLVFAVSLGETRAASRVIQGLLDRGETVILTHGSPAGLTAGQAFFADAIASDQMVQGYMPVDLFWAVRLFLTRQRPKLGLVVEAELWPGLMAEAARAGVPMVQINGNYTERAFRLDQKPTRLGRAAFWRFYSQIITKSQERANRYLRAGVDPDRVTIVGELKFDLEVKTHQKEAAEVLRALMGTNPTLTIASSIEAEEGVLMQVLTRLRAEAADPPRIIWVPRSPQRFGPVAEMLTAKGLRVILRSEMFDDRLATTGSLGNWDVLVGDSIGEMDFYYTLGDVVFVGATLAPMGGHNIIEPLALEKPVVTGPSLHGIAYPAYDAIEVGAMIAKDTGDELADLLVTFYSNAGARAAFAAKTRGFNRNHKGASLRTVEVLTPYLERVS